MLNTDRKRGHFSGIERCMTEQIPQETTRFVCWKFLHCDNNNDVNLRTIWS